MIPLSHVSSYHGCSVPLRKILETFKASFFYFVLTTLLTEGFVLAVKKDKLT